MIRLPSFAAMLLACLLCGCGTTPRRPDRPNVVQGTGEFQYRKYWREGESVYVRITSEAPAALILAAPDPWAEPVAVLELGQELRVLDPSSGTYVRVRTVGMGFDAEGWVWRPAVGKKKPADNADTREEWQREGATSAARDTGQPTVNPSELEAALQRLGNFEQSRADVSGGAAELVRRFRRFGEVGGLSDD